MVHKGSFAIGFFDLVLGGVLANPKHLVIIFPLALLQLQLRRLQQMFMIYSQRETKATRLSENPASRYIS